MAGYAGRAEDKLIDYISGKEVNLTTEEAEAVQVFSRQLVEDYGYPKDHIQTHPQYRVKLRPSDTKKEYPVDIAVFTSEKKTEGNIYIIVECKKKNRKDGRTQLENYLTLSSAPVGVWFNGEERFFLRKVVNQAGEVFFEEIPNIPRYKERLEDIGKFARSALKPTHNLKTIFRSIRGYLAANNVGATRDEMLAQQIINIIFCKIYDEKYTPPDAIVRFRAGLGESVKEIEERLFALFEEVKKTLPEVIEREDKISLDSNSIRVIVGELQNYSLITCERDVIADAFETFIGHALKGGQGQFFTPRNVVKMVVDILQPGEEDKIIDPACGSGGFLIESLKFVWERIDAKYQRLGWSRSDIDRRKIEAATKNFRGIDKDYFLSKVAKTYMNLIGDGTTGIFCEDSLEEPEHWHTETQSKIKLGDFDILLTNPPFGDKIKVEGEKKLAQFDVARKWMFNKETASWEMSARLKDKEEPQVLFVERALSFLKDGGRMAIVLPETFFHAPKLHYVIDFLSRHNIMWVIDLPHNTFRPNNNAKCCVLIIQKNTRQQQKINMAVAVEMGHDHIGRPMYRWDYKAQAVDRASLWDDIEMIIAEIQNPSLARKYTFTVEQGLPLKNHILVPRYYWNSGEQEIEKIAKEQNYTLVAVQDLINARTIKYFDGHGSPEADNKGMGEVPYIRVKDIVNWEVYKDPTALIPYHVFADMRNDAKKLYEKDLLFVRRGSYRIGSVALI